MGSIAEYVIRRWALVGRRDMTGGLYFCSWILPSLTASQLPWDEYCSSARLSHHEILHQKPTNHGLNVLKTMSQNKPLTMVGPSSWTFKIGSKTSLFSLQNVEPWIFCYSNGKQANNICSELLHLLVDCSWLWVFFLG